MAVSFVLLPLLVVAIPAAALLGDGEFNFLLALQRDYARGFGFKTVDV
jgi:hypothetical protein